MTMKLMTTLGAAATLALFSTLGAAKLPAPSDEAKAKAAETAAKTAHTGKVDGYKLCKSMDSVAAAYYADAKKAGKDAKPATATPPCADPGAFVYPPPVPAWRPELWKVLRPRRPKPAAVATAPKK
jgi:hypothetical protein